MKNLALALCGIAAALFIAQSAWNIKKAADDRETARRANVERIIADAIGY